MRNIKGPRMQRISQVAIVLVTASSLAVAQSTPWRHVGDPAPAPSGQQAQAQTAPDQSQNPEPVETQDPAAQPAMPAQPPAPAAQPGAQSTPPPYGVPPQLTVKPGTYISVRINQALATNHNQPGDTFTATLMQPLVVDGIVVANRGQLVYGRVADLAKQHADKPSWIKLELTSFTLADGTQVQAQTQLVARQGGTTPAGVQAGTVAGTTVAGAAIGGAAAWGTGAAIGAGAGAAAGMIGVILTRNHPTIIYPETALTFQTMAPMTISTTSSPQAFRYVGPEDYNHPGMQTATGSRRVPPPGYSYYYAPGYGYPYPYPYYGYSYPWYPYWGVGIGWGWGWGRPWGWGRWR